MNTIQIQKGNPYEKTVTFSYASGTAYDLTDKTVLFTLKYLEDDADNDADALITQDITVHTDPTEGETTLSLSEDDTDIALGQYKCDFRVYAEGVVQSNTTTFYADIVDIVTKRKDT